ncbi:CD99 antigen-like protein 2 isoform X2 [Coregonus clupeaformis]|uniref:CD99 antigen-like protein 2 isoform X2 n=1 Tax=Coregonus clupeaformis TaxID=59861 RepID=UPI001BDFBC01|nr:CD99 antigen-like protein 2 isoform X2 [Coregonus clupeaformis]
MGKCSAWSLFLVVSLLAMKALSQNEGGFDLSDALDGDVSKTPATPKPKPVEGAGEEFFGEDEKITTTNVPPKAPATKAPPHKPKPDEIQADFDFEPSPRPGLLPRATKGPHTPPKPQPASEFDLSDALDPNNDIGGKDKNKGQADKGIGGGGRGDPNNRGGNGGGSFSDDDLFDVGKDDTYNPDKGKGGRGGSQSAADDNNYDTVAETGTIAGIISAIGVALVGMVTSYVSYQKKKFCFSIQQSLNADLVKTDNPEAVVATEPQVQQTLLEPPNAEPPSEENTV